MGILLEKKGWFVRYRRPLETFNGPYITHVPDIKVIDLNKNDKYLILSSDGMWDELNKEDVEVFSSSITMTRLPELLSLN